MEECGLSGLHSFGNTTLMPISHRNGMVTENQLLFK